MKKLIKTIINKIGYDFHRLNFENNSNNNLAYYLNKNNVNLVFDIGANIGQFAQELRLTRYLGAIVSFEPLIDEHCQLTKLSQNEEKWSVHPRSAIGDFGGEIEINVAGNSVSSSVLPMLDTHSSAASGSAYTRNETTPICTLDSVSTHYLKETDKLFIKIDTQGYEWQVLDGAEETLKLACGLHIELSLVPLYDGQRLWMDIIERLNAKGFDLWNINKGFTDSRDGRLLQIDATFFRK
jgi:FkbM family methyltransferase